MVVLVRVATAGRGLIYTSASFSGQSDFFLKNSAFVSTPLSQNPPVLLPPKSVCPLQSAYVSDAAASPFPAVITPLRGGRKRYNTLDFLSWFSANSRKSRVPTGMLLAPIGNPEPKGYSPLDTPYFLRRLVPKL